VFFQCVRSLLVRSLGGELPVQQGRPLGLELPLALSFGKRRMAMTRKCLRRIGAELLHPLSSTFS
jgi:hypothetical protein